MLNALQIVQAMSLQSQQYMSGSKDIWLEKYRPKELNEVFGNIEQVNTLRTCVGQGSIPHLILSGPPGVGKTSTVLCIVKEMLGNKCKEAVLELNASDERGIDVVREQIKTFAYKKVSLPPGRTKVIILDEADSLTEGAQQALRMIISNYSDTTRFVLSCNNSQKIIEAIQSRCIILRFNRLKDEEVELNLARIIKGEGVRISTDAFKTLLFVADGDMRQAINSLQACHFSVRGEIITEQVILAVCDVPSIQELQKILNLVINKQINEALFRMHALYTEGYSIYDIVNSIQKILMNMGSIKVETHFQMLKYVAELKKRILDGLTSQIQLGQFLAKCASLP